MKKQKKVLGIALGAGALVASLIPLHNAVATSSPASDAFSFTVGSDGELLANGAGAELVLIADCELGQRVHYINSRLSQARSNGFISSSNVYEDQPGIDCNGQPQEFPMTFVANSLAYTEGSALVSTFVTVCQTNPDPYYAQFHWYDFNCVEYREITTIALSQPAPPVQVTPVGALVTEGDTGTTTANVVVRLDAAADAPVTIDYETVGDPGVSGLAVRGVDFAATSGTVTFEPGETEVTVPIDVFGDTEVEDPLLYGEWGLVKFSNPSSNAVLDTTTFFGHGLIIIIDDDVDSGVG